MAEVAAVSGIGAVPTLITFHYLPIHENGPKLDAEGNAAQESE